jgi:hypothetical protein
MAGCTSCSQESPHHVMKRGPFSAPITHPPMGPPAKSVRPWQRPRCTSVEHHITTTPPSIALHPHLQRPHPGALPTMLSRSTACRGAQRAARQQTFAAVQRRGLAAPASGSFQYQSGEAKGVKFASRDFAGPTTTLALVAKAGTRYQTLPGLTEGLANFAFRVRPPRLPHLLPTDSPRALSAAPPCASSASRSCSAPRSMPTTRART